MLYLFESCKTVLPMHFIWSRASYIMWYYKVFALLVCQLKCIQSLDESWDHQLWLDVNYHLRWTVHSDRQSITFLCEVRTRGWVGLGLSPNGGMSGSDLVIGWVDDNSGRTHFDVSHRNARIELKANRFSGQVCFRWVFATNRWESGLESVGLRTKLNPYYPEVQSTPNIMWQVIRQRHNSGHNSSDLCLQ